MATAGCRLNPFTQRQNQHVLTGTMPKAFFIKEKACFLCHYYLPQSKFVD
jgi:hypothetical protein